MPDLKGHQQIPETVRQIWCATAKSEKSVGEIIAF
jgi:hypothetical protein